MLHQVGPATPPPQASFPLFVSASSAPPSHTFESKLKVLQIQMKAEKNKTLMSEEVIKGLKSDKAHLQQEVARLKELLAQKTEKQVKTGKLQDAICNQDTKLYLGLTFKKQRCSRSHLNIYFIYLDEMTEDKNCPLPPMDGYPECKGKLKVTYLSFLIFFNIYLPMEN